MTDFSRLFNDAELALASYADLVHGSLSDQRARLEASGLSAKQAEEFARKYPVVVAQYNDTVSEGGLGTSFSATVFRDSANNLTLAIRGTYELVASPSDLIPTDATIAASGVGYDQVVAMWNWWQRASNVAGVSVTQYRLVATPADLSHATWISGAGLWLEWYTGTANGTLRDALALDADRKLDLTGHSLGGHLAMAFGAIFPSVAGQVTVFNAPGFKDDSDNRTFFALLGGAIPNGANTTNVIANEAGIGEVPWSGIAGKHSRPGTAIDIPIEDQWLSDEANPTRGSWNHSQQILTDALAVYAALAKLAPALSTATFKSILQAAAVGTSSSLERTVDALENFFGINPEPLPTGNTNRDALYRALYGLQGNALYQAAQGRVILENLANKTAAGLEGLARDGDIDALAYRYALRELNPFAILGVDYSRFNQNGELDLYDPATGRGELTAEYLADRAAFLAWRNRLALEDIDASGVAYDRSGAPDLWYRDNAANLTLNLGNQGPVTDKRRLVFGADQSGSTETLSGGSQADRLYGGGGDDVLYGFDRNDRLEGGAGDDRLYGGDGDDILVGGAGDDRLEGGKGFDTYLVGRGTDTIVDEDGQGIVIDGQGRVLGGAFVQGADGRYTWAGNGQVSAARNAALTITLENGARVVIENYDAFAEGELGIALIDAAPALQPVRTIVGDLAPLDTDPGVPGVQFGYDELGNVRVTDAPEAGRADTLYDSAGSDLIRAGGGEDLINATRGGDDRLEGGAGRDIISGGQGGDILLGEAGSDILAGEDGDDRLYAGAEVEIIQAIARGNSEAGSGSRGDWLNGGVGNDVLVAGADNDALFGGAGEDLLIGGAGDDMLDGDDDFTATSFEWSVSGSDNIFDPIIGPVAIHNASPVAGGADVLYGGSGNDRLSGLLGNDVLYGEAGNDIMAGDDGADVLFGGTGNDIMTGDYGRLVYDSNGRPVVQGDDWLDGGDGDDWMQGEGGNDDLYGGAGADTLVGDAGYLPSDRHGEDYLDGGAGNDALVGGGRNDVLLGGDGADTLVGDGEDIAAEHQGDDWLDGGAGADLLKGYGGNDTLLGGADNDELQGDAGNDWLEGGDGNDLLFGGDGNDTLDGGAGTDVLIGGAGKDTYVFNKGDGVETIIDDSFGLEASVLVFGQGVDLSRIKLRRGSLLIDMGDGDAIHIENFDPDAPLSDPAFEAFQFSGGGTLSWNELLARGFDLDGTAGDDTIAGTALVDRIQGLGGNDTLIGKAGDDLLAGGAGNDTYVFGRGDGVDQVTDLIGINTIRFGAGIALADLHLNSRRLGALEYLEIAYDDAGSRILVLNGLNGGVERYQFDDGTVLTRDQLLALADKPGSLLTGGDEAEVLQGWSEGDCNIAGGNGNDTLIGGDRNDYLDGGAGHDILEGGDGTDTLVGGDGDDTLNGGAGNDTLQGGAGSDVYVLGWSMGLDTVVESGSEISTVKLGMGLDFSDLELRRQGNDLYLGIAGPRNIDFSNLDAYGDTQCEPWAAPGALLLEDYYAPQNGATGGTGMPAWQVRTESGDSMALSDLQQQLVAHAEDPARQAYDQWITSVRQTFAADVQAAGAIQVGDNRFEAISAYGRQVYALEFRNQSSDASAIGRSSPSSAYSATPSGASYTMQVPAMSGAAFGSGSYLIPYYDDTRLDQAGNPTLIGFSTVGNGIPGASMEEFTVTLTGSDTYSGSVIETIEAGPSNNTIVSWGGTAVFGGAGNDTIWTQYWGAYDPVGNYLNGGDGNDSIFGSYNNDVILAGSGNDLLSGDQGDDTYLINPDDTGTKIIDEVFWRINVPGIGYIYENNGRYSTDTVEFAPGLTPDDIAVTRGTLSPVADLNGASIDAGETYETLDLDFRNQTVRVVLPQPGNTYPWAGGWGVEFFRFADGTQLTMEEMIGRIAARDGTEGNDVLRGGSQDDLLAGLGGDDTIAAGNGNDVLDGGPGNDALDGGLGDDTYVFNPGDGIDRITDAGGTDTLAFGDGIDPDAVTLGLGSLLIRTGTGADAIHIEGFDPDAPFDNPVIENFRFHDGTVLSFEQLLARGFDIAGDGELRGTGLTDRMTGGAGGDVLMGGAGDDTLAGGAGSDTYALRQGDGNDTVIDVADEGAGNRILFGEGIASGSLAFAQEADGLRIRYGDGDSVLLSGYGIGGNRVVAELWFADGSVASLTEFDGTSGSGKGNEGLGNGEDPPPPGHDYNNNDGPGTSPGNPGARDHRGQHNSRRGGEGHDEADDWLDGWGRSHFSDSLDPRNIAGHANDSESRHGSRRQGRDEIFARWQAMDRALADIECDSWNPWQDERSGAYGSLKHFAASGDSVASRVFAGDRLSLHVGSGTHLETFGGLQEGFAKIA